MATKQLPSFVSSPAAVPHKLSCALFQLAPAPHRASYRIGSALNDLPPAAMIAVGYQANAIDHIACAAVSTGHI